MGAVRAPSEMYEGHPLYQASSPLVRALPDYARQFRQHLARGEALLQLTQVHLGPKPQTLNTLASQRLAVVVATRCLTTWAGGALLHRDCALPDWARLLASPSDQQVPGLVHLQPWEVIAHDLSWRRFGCLCALPWPSCQGLVGLQARAATCQQLVADMDVQGRAMDAARANVEQHYTFIQSRHTDFMRRWVAGSPAEQG